MASLHPLDVSRANDVLLKYVFSGELGSAQGMAVSYALLHTTHNTFTYLAALSPLDDSPRPSDRYQIRINRRTKEISAPKKLEITHEEMQKAISAATGETVASSSMFPDMKPSTSYKVTTREKPHTAYMVQLRHHGKVTSADAFVKFVNANSRPGAIPLPTVYPIPGEAEHQQTTGLGRQITEFIPGVMAIEVYPAMSFAGKLGFVRHMALAWQACWDLPLPSPRRVGELIATADGDDDNVALTVGPDRRSGLGGPFASVREWLAARLKRAVWGLEAQGSIEEDMEECLDAVKAFVENCPGRIPETVEECPIVALHAGMGLRDVMVSADDHMEIEAIVDWESCASAALPAAWDCVEVLFRKRHRTGFGAEYPNADELREAFWNAIPRWKDRWESRGARDCKEWLRLACVLESEYCTYRFGAERFESWAGNIRIVKEMLQKYGGEEGI